MPTPLENELGLGPAMHRARKRFHGLLAQLGGDGASQEQQALDPLTVNYAAWDAVRRGAREWPNFKEAPNSLEVLVSPEDWQDYWGIDALRKEQGVADYVRSRAAEKGYWMAGEPQVIVMADDAVEMGDVEVMCQFAEPVGGEDFLPLSEPATQRFDARGDEALSSGSDAGASASAVARRPARQGTRPGARPEARPNGKRSSKPVARPSGKPGARPVARPVDKPEDEVGVAAAASLTNEALLPAPAPTPTMRLIDPEFAPKAALTDDEGFRLVVSSGDCIGAVREGEEVPEEVNVRIDAEGFPYVDVKQCELQVLDGRWTVTNHSYHGTKLVTADGRRMMLGEPEPYPIMEGDVLYLGPTRPLRFELV